MGNVRRKNQFYYTMHKEPIQIDCNFIVDPTNGNGLGIRSLKGAGVPAVYMHTTPAATTATSVFASGVTTVPVSSTVNLVLGEVVTDTTTSGNIAGGTTIIAINTISNTVTLSSATLGASAASPGDTLSFAMTAALAGNPNPASGYIDVRFDSNYNFYYGGYSGFVSPLSGAPLTSTTAGSVYVITSLGTTTLAQWQAAGLVVGNAPLVGSSFTAIATGAIGGTGTVEVPATTHSGIDHIEVIGDANLTLQSSAGSVFGRANGSGMRLACLFEGALTAPAAGTAIGLTFVFSNSAVTVAGD